MTRSIWIKAADAAGPRGPNHLPNDGEGRNDIRFIRTAEKFALAVLALAQVSSPSFCDVQWHIGG
jgi:hypothetical protein